MKTLEIVEIPAVNSSIQRKPAKLIAAMDLVQVKVSVNTVTHPKSATTSSALASVLMVTVAVCAIQ